jgi:hypothetical protein
LLAAAYFTPTEGVLSMLPSPSAVPWWAWLLCAAFLAVLSVFALAFAVMPQESRPGGWGCVFLTGLLVIATLATGAFGIALVVERAWPG